MDSEAILLRCAHCKAWKPEDQFHRHKTRPTGRHHYCKLCHRRNPNPREPVFRRHGGPLKPPLEIAPGYLWCTGCASEKLVELFSRNKHQRSGRANWCKSCIKRLWQRPDYQKRRMQRRNEDWPHSLSVECRSRAKKQGVACNITRDDIQIPEFCPVLGIKLVPMQGRRAEDCPSIDRIDPYQGYVKGNVAVISWKANRLKSNCGDPAVFDAIAAYIRRGLNAAQEHRSGISTAPALQCVSHAAGTVGVPRGASKGRKKRRRGDGSD